MSYGVVDIKRFGGLDLRADPADVSLEHALTASNVDLARDRSYVRVRDGISQLGADNAMGGSLNVVLKLIDAGDIGGGIYRLLAIVHNTSGDALAYTYTILGVVALKNSWTHGTVNFHDAVAFGTPTAGYVFVSTDGQLMQRYLDAGMLSSVGKPKYLGVTPVSNRLVQAWFNAAADPATGVNGSRSTVYFSDAGAPETFSTNNYVHLRPGDGEEIRGVATWRGQTFVFKESTAWVFGPEGTSSSGTPIFDNRAITLPSRIPKVNASLQGAVVGAGDAGVYFLALDGLYRTTGGPPMKVSQPLDDLFRRGAITAKFIAVEGPRVVIHTASTLYVYDDRHGEWVTWLSLIEQPTAPLASWPAGSSGDPERLFWGIGATLFHTDLNATTDDGQAITSVYQTGYSDLAAPTVKTVRQVQAWGTGAPTVSMAVDYATADSGAAMTLGTSPAIDDAIQRIARRGTHFSLKAAAAGGAWRLHSAALHARPPRAPGAKP